MGIFAKFFGKGCDCGGGGCDCGGDKAEDEGTMETAPEPTEETPQE